MKITKHWFLSFTIFVVFIIILPICIGYSIYNNKNKNMQIYNYELRKSNLTFHSRLSTYHHYILCNTNNWECIKSKKVLWLYANSWIIYLYTLYNNYKIYEDEVIELETDNMTNIEKNIFEIISQEPKECWMRRQYRNTKLEEEDILFDCFMSNPNIIID